MRALLPPYLLLLKIVGAVAVLAAVSFGTYRLTADHYLAVIDQEHLAQQQAATAALQQRQQEMAETATRVMEAQRQHNEDQAVINDLSARNQRLQRIHVPTCGPAASSEHPPATDTDGGAGAFSERIDEALERFKNGMDALVRRCDQLNIDAIQHNRQVEATR